MTSLNEQIDARKEASTLGFLVGCFRAGTEFFEVLELDRFDSLF